VDIEFISHSRERSGGKYAGGDEQKRIFLGDSTAAAAVASAVIFEIENFAFRGVFAQQTISRTLNR